MSGSFRGQQRVDDEGKRQGSTPIKYAVKQEDFIGGERIEAFGLDVTLIVCRPLPEDKGTDIGSEPQTKSGSRETRRGKILGIGYFRYRGQKNGRSGVPRPNEKRDAEGAEATGALSRRPLRVVRR